MELQNKKSRKRKRNPEKWKQTVRKDKRQHGEEYTDVKGRTHLQKNVTTRHAIQINAVLNAII